MTAQGKWRERLALIPGNTYRRVPGFFPDQDQVMLPKQDYQDLLEAARSVVAAHNATEETEPVVWQSKAITNDWWSSIDGPTARTMMERPEQWHVRPLYTRPAADPVAVVEKLRADGWSVAVHNDYRLAGEQRTFWLFTHADGHQMVSRVMAFEALKATSLCRGG